MHLDVGGGVVFDRNGGVLKLVRPVVGTVGRDVEQRRDAQPLQELKLACVGGRTQVQMVDNVHRHALEKRVYQTLVEQLRV